MPLAHRSRAFALAALVAAAPAAAEVALAPQTIKEDTPRLVVDITYPQTGNAAIDADLKKWAEGLVSEMRAMSAEDDTPERPPYSVELSYDAPRNDGEMLVLSFAVSTYAGGAHGFTQPVTYNYLMPDGYQVELIDIVGVPGIAKISEIATADLLQQLGGPDAMSDDEWIRRGSGPAEENFDAFEWRADSLLITFAPYQVAAYAAGPQEVSIPLAQLADVIRSDWRAPQPSFDCAKAGTAVEKSICGDVALARLDRKLARAYRATLAGAYEEPKQKEIRDAQRAWLKSRTGACGAEKDAALVKCLSDLYVKRIRALSATP